LCGDFWVIDAYRAELFLHIASLTLLCKLNLRLVDLLGLISTESAELEVEYKAPLYAISVKYVNPRGTSHSKEHDELMKRYCLDRHSASAYLIAIKGLKTP